MVLLLLMGALLTANVAAGVKYNQPVGTKKSDQATAFQNIWDTLFRCMPQFVVFFVINYTESFLFPPKGKAKDV